MALASSGQDDFSAGVYRGRKAPAGAVYDAVNALIDDEGRLFKRGGSMYLSSVDAGVDLVRVTVGNFPGPQANRTIAWGTKGYVLGDGNQPIEIFDGSGEVYGRPVSVGGVMVWPILQGSGGGHRFSQILVYGGSWITAQVINEGTITITAGSTAVTKSGGASWVGKVAPGMILGAMVDGAGFGLVRSVDGANALTLAYPYGGATVSTGSYDIVPTQAHAVAATLPPDIPASDRNVLGAAAQRLLVGIGDRVYVADRSTAGPVFRFDPQIYHEIPGSAEITGIEGIGDSAVIYTTAGTWLISNLSFDVVDAFGNIQQTVQRLNGEIVLWGEAGITAWAGGVITPALDDIHILGLDGSSVPITGDSENEKVRRLYRSYVRANYQPGMAEVHQGHLFLPILNGSTVVDVLVCRLDRGAAWTRWSGHAAGRAFAVLPASPSAGPQLLSVQGRRVTNAVNTFNPAGWNAADADGTVPNLVITTRDYPTGQQPGFVDKARLRYELADDGNGSTPPPTVAVAFSSDQDAGSFATLAESGLQGGGTGGAVSDGSRYSWWKVRKRRERIRLRITVSGACASFVLRSIELLTRPQGKQ